MSKFQKDDADVNGALVELFYMARKREELSQKDYKEAEISALWYVKAFASAILEEMPKAKRKLLVAQIADRTQFIAEYYGLPD